MTVVLIGGERFGHRDTPCGDGVRDWSDAAKWSKPKHAEDCWQSPKVGREARKALPRAPRGS